MIYICVLAGKQTDRRTCRASRLDEKQTEKQKACITDSWINRQADEKMTIRAEKETIFRSYINN